MTLSTDRCRVTLSKEHKGGIVSLVDEATGVDLVAKQANPRLFLLGLSRVDDPEGRRKYLQSRDARNVSFETDDTGATLRYEGFEAIEATVTCYVVASDEDGLVHVRLEASYPDEMALEVLQYPFIVLRTPPSEGREDALVFGHTKGGVHHRPRDWAQNRRLYGSQPGSLAAQFGCYYDGGVGAFSAAFDARGYPKMFECRRVPEGLEMTWTRQALDAGSFRLGHDCVLGSFSAGDGSTDWRHGADIYKAWAERQHWCARKFADRADVPEWMKSGPAMVRFNRVWLSDPTAIERWLEDYWQRFFPADQHLITAYWGWEKVATWVTPDYFPCYPSDEEFRRIVQFGRERNCHAFPWPSGYHYTRTYEAREDGTFEWDDRERFDAVARPHAVHERDGSLYARKASWLRGGENAAMCPGDPWTIDWLNEIAVKLVERGCDMVQVDQVVGGAFPTCFSPDHPHPRGHGLWKTEVFRRQLETMLAECRRIDPEAVVCFEEPNERFIQQAAIQDYRDWEVLRRGDDAAMPESVFNYIYHEYLPTFQSNPGFADRVTEAYCLVSGQIPHIVPSRVTGPGPMLVNGTFEGWADNVPTGWDKVPGYQGEVWPGKCFRDDAEKHSGDSSLRLVNELPTDTVQVSQNVFFAGDFQTGQRYRVSIWMKSSGLQRPNSVMFGTFAPGLKHTGGARIDIPQDTGGEWARGETIFEASTGSEMLRIMQHVAGPGTVWLDDMVLEKALPDGTFEEVTRSETPPDHDLMSRWIELFSGEACKYLLHGRMLHLPPLRTGTLRYADRDFPAILHNAYRAADGSEAVVMVNTTTEAQEAVLTWQGRERKLSLEPWEVRLVED